MKRAAVSEVDVMTPKNVRRPPEVVPAAPKKKRVCFRCKEEGHFSSKCMKALRNVRPRCRMDLGQSVYVSVFPSKREPTVHIRRYGEGDDNPTQDGVELTLTRWMELEALTEVIEKAVNAYDDPDEEDVPLWRHLGANWYVSVKRGYRCVDIRRFWVPEESTDLRATRDGIALNWEKLMDTFEELTSFVPELRDVIRCIMREDHMNQLGALRCPECNPNDCQNW